MLSDLLFYLSLSAVLAAVWLLTEPRIRRAATRYELFRVCGVPLSKRERIANRFVKAVLYVDERLHRLYSFGGGL